MKLTTTCFTFHADTLSFQKYRFTAYTNTILMIMKPRKQFSL